MTLKDSTKHSQGCLMAYYGARDGSKQSQDCVVMICRMRLWSNRYDTITWAKESKTGYYFGQIYHENKA